MTSLDPLAVDLNKILADTNPALLDLLSERGKRIFYPKKGLLGQSAEAKGKRINATVGMSMNDDRSPMRLASVEKHLDIAPEEAFTYAPSQGIPELRRTWQEQIKKKNPSLTGDISLPLVTSGLTHGLFVTGQMFMNPGDTVILPEIFWGNYTLVFKHNCGVSFQHYPPFTGERFNLAGLASCLTGENGKKIVLLNFPHNPTGYTLTETEAEDITRILLESAEKGNRILVLLDDAYFGLVYEEGIYRESLFAKLADLHDNILTAKIDGATKEEYAWGFRIGFITYASRSLTPEATTALEEKTAGTIRSSISSASHLSQALIYHSLVSPEHEKDKKEKYRILRNRYRRVRTILAENEEIYAPYFKPMPCNSGYFICLKLQPRLNAESVRRKLLNEMDIGVIALGDLLRLAFSSVPEADLSLLFDAIYSCCQDLAK